MGAAQSSQKEYTLHTELGSLQGIETSRLEDGKPVYRRYTKVPYARPPTGPYRWRRPQPLPLDFSFNAAAGQPGRYTSFGPVCPQPVYATSEVLVDNPKAAPPIENVQSEDCLYLNIWTPAAEPPEDGWPVQVYIHGGWLQVGDAAQNNTNEPFDLFNDTDVPRIIVAPTYRLNLFGFLAGHVLSEANEDESSGNYGFWDQRMALEWIHDHIALFGGNRENITVGGLSAGAHSTFFQLYYDLHLPESQRIIKRVYLWSNAVGIQPSSNTSTAASEQFDELIDNLSISRSLSPKEKLSLLREVSSEGLVRAIERLNMHTFRATTDDCFIPPTFLSSLHNGAFTSKLKDSGVKMMIGEVANEDLLYRVVNPPSSLEGLVVQLQNYYPEPVVQALLKVYPLPSHNAAPSEWADIFGQIAADGQVFATERGLVYSLFNPPNGAMGLTTNEIFRYRISWRAKSLDGWLKPEAGVCHAADGPIWWHSGWRAGYTEKDKQAVRDFIRPFEGFMGGRTPEWGTKSASEIREMRSGDGHVQIIQDDKWKRGLEVWRTMQDAYK